MPRLDWNQQAREIVKALPRTHERRRCRTEKIPPPDRDIAKAEMQGKTGRMIREGLTLKYARLGAGALVAVGGFNTPHAPWSFSGQNESLGQAGPLFFRREAQGQNAVKGRFDMIGSFSAASVGHSRDRCGHIGQHSRLRAICAIQSRVWASGLWVGCGFVRAARRRIPAA